MTCADEPAPPAGPVGQPVTDAEAVRYLIDLRAAWFSCRSTVDYLRIWHEAMR